MRDIVFITFDLPRSDYPSMSYSIASIMATLKINSFRCAHYPIDVKQILEDKKYDITITEVVKKQLSDAAEYFSSFRFVAISVTRWSIEHALSLIDLIKNSKCKIILGGYEITAIEDTLLLKEFSNVDFFIKGYAERAIIKILKNEYPSEKKIIREPIDIRDMASPYLNGIINPFSRKLYWEAKRGCTYKCGFCEWGNAEGKMVVIPKERLYAEMELFKNSCVEELNILDGVFNHGLDYIAILEKLIKETEVIITFQARFENLIGKRGNKFLDFCELNKNRIHMEFGLQTIHPKEMDNIGRKNDLKKVKTIIDKLNRKAIVYEVSIIYAIPGQTVETFIDTIEFLLTNNCRTIRAYPLQIPRNSILESKKEEFQIEEQIDKFNVKSVSSSFSFTKENRSDMDKIAELLNTDQLQKQELSDQHLTKLNKVTEYQYEISSKPKWIDKSKLNFLLEEYYIQASISDIGEEDRSQSFYWIGHLSKYYNNELSKEKFYSDIVEGKFSIKLHKWEYNDSNVDPRIKIKRNPNLHPKKYHCKLRIARSGNIYVFRDIEVLSENDVTPYEN